MSYPEGFFTLGKKDANSLATYILDHLPIDVSKKYPSADKFYEAVVSGEVGTATKEGDEITLSIPIPNQDPFLFRWRQHVNDLVIDNAQFGYLSTLESIETYLKESEPVRGIYCISSQNLKWEDMQSKVREFVKNEANGFVFQPDANQEFYFNEEREMGVTILSEEDEETLFFDVTMTVFIAFMSLEVFTAISEDKDEVADDEDAYQEIEKAISKDLH